MRARSASPAGALRFASQKTCPLHRLIAAALRTGQLLLQGGLVRGGLGGPLAQRAELALQCRALTLECAQGLGLLMQLLLPLADEITLLAEAAPHVVLGLGTPGQLGSDSLVLHRRGVAVAGGGLLLDHRMLGAKAHLAALFGRAQPARVGVGQALGGESEIALHLAEVDPHRGQPAGDLRAMPLGGEPRMGGFFPMALAGGEVLAGRGNVLGQLREARLHPRDFFRHPVEQAAGQGKLDRELLLGELDVPLGFAALAREASDLGLYLSDEVLDALKIDGGLLQPALGAVLPIAIQPDARRLLEEGASLVRPVRQQQVDHLGLDDHAGIAAQSRATEQILDVAQPDRRTVEQIVALPGPREPAGDDHFAVGDGKVAVGVVEVQRDLGDVHRAPGGGALEDDVLHLPAAEQSRRLFAEHPADRVGHVALPAAVRSHDGRHPFLEGEVDRVGERLEAGELQPRELHARIPGSGCASAPVDPAR